jgi:hypothetical protein
MRDRLPTIYFILIAFALGLIIGPRLSSEAVAEPPKPTPVASVKLTDAPGHAAVLISGVTGRLMVECVDKKPAKIQQPGYFQATNGTRNFLCWPEE